jgi:hypothetical protein
MKEKLQQALAKCEEICADVNGNYPVGLLYVRRPLEEVIADCRDEEDVAMLAEEPPLPAA